MATTEQITTAGQLLHASDLGRCELVRGELVMMSPSGFRHGEVVAAVTEYLRAFVRQRALGSVTGAESGFRIAHDPDTVRAPDVGFVRAERIPPAKPLGFFEGAPDLAVEVLSPDDRASEVTAKVRGWLDAGSAEVWVVDPKTQTVTVYRGANQTLLLRTADALSGGDLLPGFSLPVAEIFAP